MKLLEARKLIKDTFENPFGKERFALFINNLLKDKYEQKPFIQAGAQLPAAYAEHFRKLERIGKYEDSEGNVVDLLIVELKRQHSIEWARTAQRNFIRRYLNGSRGGALKDAAITTSGMGTNRWLKYKVEQLPIPSPTNTAKGLMESFVQKIMARKKQSPDADTQEWEHQIDLMVYHLYNLTYQEARIIDPDLKEEEFEKYRPDK